MGKTNRRGHTEGSVYFHKPSNLWAVQLAYGFSESGKPKRKTMYAKTQKEALELLLATRAKTSQGIFCDAKGWTVAEFLRHWLEASVRPNLKQNTYTAYEVTVRRHIVPKLGGVKLEKLSATSIRTMLLELEREGKSVRVRQLAHDVLSIALKAAVSDDLIVKSPLPRGTRPKSRRLRKFTPFTLDEAQRFLEASKDDRFSALFVLAIFTGMRRGELLALKWDDVHFSSNSLAVQRTVSDIAGKLVIGEPKTQAGVRRIEVPSFAIDALNHHRARMKEEGLDSPWIFCNVNGELMRPNNLVRRHFKPLLQTANLPAIRFHDLRHTAATIMLLEAKIPTKVVQEILGHASTYVTNDIYSHVMPSMQREAAHAMGALLGRT